MQLDFNKQELTDLPRAFPEPFRGPGDFRPLGSTVTGVDSYPQQWDAGHKAWTRISVDSPVHDK